MREITHLGRIGSADAELERPADGRPELEGTDARQHLFEFRLPQGSKDPLLNTGACLEALGDHHGLREEIIGELLIERQVEADGTATDVERPTLDVRVGLQDLLEVVDHLLRRIDRGALRQRQIDQELGPIRAREELLLHELHAGERRDEQRDSAGDDRVSSPAARDRAGCGTRAQSATARGRGP